jgi:hypothetical protein
VQTKWWRWCAVTTIHAFGVVKMTVDEVHPISHVLYKGVQVTVSIFHVIGVDVEQPYHFVQSMVMVVPNGAGDMAHNGVDV